MEKHQFVLMLEKFNLLLEELAEIRSRIIDVETVIKERSVPMVEHTGPEKVEVVNIKGECLTDTELISFLEEENKKCRYTGNCAFRLSTTRRGWRLHETSKPQGCSTVREAITRALLERDWRLRRGKKEEEGKSEDNKGK